MIRRLFRPPVFEQEDKNFRAKFINGFAWSVIALLLLAMAPHLFGTAKNFTIPIFSGLILVMLLALYLLHRGNVDASGTIIIVLSWLGVSVQAYTADGVKDAIVVAFIALGFLASIIINWRIGSAVVLSGIAVIWALALLQVNNVFVPSSRPNRILGSFLVFIAITVLVYFSTRVCRTPFGRRQ
jgi:FtsH-binding integral membrane protein